MRKPYKWGAKAYLASMEVGETRTDDGRYNWRGLQFIAAQMQRDYGSKFVFRTKQKAGYRQVTRIN